MPRRVAIALLNRPRWSPPGVSPEEWRLALHEDVTDVLATLAEVEAAVAVIAEDADLLGRTGWPGMRRYVLPVLDVGTALTAATADGFDHAAVLAGDAPDLPGMLIAKLLRPLTSRPVAAAPVHGERPGLLGFAAALPAPGWLPRFDLDGETPQGLRKHAPRATDVAPAPGWHRLRAEGDLARLDPGLDGWDNTRALLAGARSE